MQAAEEEPEVKPDDSPKDEPPPEPLGTNVTGNGPPDGFGLGRGRGGSTIGGGSGSGRGAGSKFGWYGGQVKAKITERARSNRKTRSASIGGVELRVWVDQTGRVTRVKLSGSTGDPAVDTALQNEVLSGMQLQEPPPAGMPMPIVLRLSARRPS
jgi:TonB family protein